MTTNIYSYCSSCPYDYVKVYDGLTNEAEAIGTYCGRKHKGLSLYSTNENLHIEFRTQRGRVTPTQGSYVPYWEIKNTKIQRRGFLAEFEISNRFINLGDYLFLHVYD